MTVKRFRVALGVALLGVALMTGTATAQVLTGSGTSGGDVGPNHETITPPNSTEGETVTNDTPRSSEAPASTSGGLLPFTGADVVELSIIGLGAIGAGTIMVRRSRTRRVTT